MDKNNQQEKYNRFLNDILKSKLYEPASELIEKLEAKYNVTPANARKILSRAVKSKTIKSSDPHTFGRGQFVYIYNEAEFDKQAIKKITEKLRPPIFRLLELMDQNDGIISFYEALKITAAPLEESSTKADSLKDILKLLSELNVVYQKKDKNDIVYIIHKVGGYEQQTLKEELLMAVHFNKMVLDCSVLPDIMRWLRKSNIIDSIAMYRSKKTPHIGMKHNNLVWDAFAYTKTTGINPTLGAIADTIEKQTMVALDVVLADDYSPIHLDAFMSRIQIDRNSVKGDKRKILPIIIYKSCSAITLNTIRANGIMAFDIGSIFGSKIHDVLNRVRDLSLLLQQDEEGIEQSIERILNTIQKTGQEEALKDLRGTLFEALMYPLLKTLYPNAEFTRGKTLSTKKDEDEKETYEYDYIINSSNPKELVFVELKGYNEKATIPLGEINPQTNIPEKASLRWFFRRALPFAAKYYEHLLVDGKQAKAVFITSANFWEDGREFLATVNKGSIKSKKLNVGYERKGLIALLKENDLETEIKIIEKFYLKSNDYKETDI